MPVGRGKRFLADISPVAWTDRRRLAVQPEHDRSRAGLPFNVTYRNAGQDRDTGPEPPEPDRRSGGAADAGAVVQRRRPSATPGSAFGRPARGTFGDLERNALRGPGYWRTDASLFKNFALGTGKQLELRIEAVNIFNHVNLGNPDTEVGVPGTPNPNAGRINETAFGNRDPQRNFQFAAKFTF